MVIEINRLILKLIWTVKDPGILKAFQEKNKVEILALPYFKISYKTSIIKIMKYSLKKKKLKNTSTDLQQLKLKSMPNERNLTQNNKNAIIPFFVEFLKT